MDEKAAIREREAASTAGEQAVALALSEPIAAIALADRISETPDADPSEQARASWARGLAFRVQNDLGRARQQLTAGAELAASVPDAELAARIRSSLALVLAYLGDTHEALRTVDAAAADLTGTNAARNEMQRALILQRAGDHATAEAAYGRALETLRRHADTSAEARLLMNRSNLRVYRGDLQGAEADLLRARDLAESHGDRLTVGLVTGNLAFVAGRAGDIPTALKRFERSVSLLRDLDVGPRRLAVAFSDGAEFLADAGLLDEAVARAADAVTALAGSDNRTELAEAELLHARMLLLAGRHDAAVETARAAADRFMSDERHAWAAQARFVMLTGELARGAPADVDAAERLADDLDRSGWRTEARRGRIGLALRALEREDREDARRLLTEARSLRPDAPAIERLQHWHAIALLRVADGDRRGARRAITAGLDVLDTHRLSFGSAELRAHAAAHARGLIELAVELALRDQRPAEAFRAIERVRAAAYVPHRPPEDQALRRSLTELRRVDAEVRTVLSRGDDPRELERQRARLEARIRGLARTRAPEGGTVPAEGDLGSVRRSLGSALLVSFVVVGDTLHRLTVTAHGVRHRELGPLEPIVQQVAGLRFGLRRLATTTTRPASAAAARASCERSLDQLDQLLRFDDVPRARDLVIVPSGVLHGLPWGALPSLTGRPISVAPSAAHWRHAAARTGQGDGVVLAAGPDLPAGDLETRDLHQLYGDAHLITGDDATVTSVLSAMRGAAIVHLAAHGEFRADNPMFSSLQWSDGRLTVYDLEHLHDPPRLIVLSSCDAANERAVAEDAVLGIASALLGLGVSSIIAAVLPIPDESTRRMMHALHERLIAGTAPALALAETCAAIDDGNPQDYALKRAFLHFGAST